MTMTTTSVVHPVLLELVLELELEMCVYPSAVYLQVYHTGREEIHGGSIACIFGP